MKNGTIFNKLYDGKKSYKIKEIHNSSEDTTQIINY